MATTDVLEIQLEREQRSRELGARRYQQMLSKRGDSETPVGERVIAGLIDSVSAAIGEWQSGSWQARKGGSVGHLCKDVDSSSLALLTLRVLLKTATRNGTFVSAAVSLGGYVEEHIGWANAIQGEHKAYFRVVGTALRSATTERHRRNVVRHVLRKKKAAPAWAEATRARLGAVLISLALKATGHFTTRTTGKGARKRKSIAVSPELASHLQRRHGEAALLTPFYGPMVCLPRPWTTPDDGGYESIKLSLMKRLPPEQAERMTLADMPQVYAAVNRLQATGWRINRPVYELMRKAWSAGERIGGLPNSELMPLPNKPWAEGEEPDPEQLVEWKRAAARVHEERARGVSKQLAVSSKLQQASELLDTTFYYVYTLDWRGRVYPMGAAMTPQSDDSGRALLEFAEGKPLGVAGQYWLAVHLANSYGYDKVPLHERVEWVLANSDAIRQSAVDPENTEWWQGADKPWCTLAACIEWTLALELGADNHITHLPIQVDGSCNGLQHFAAMLRDEKGAQAVNLAPAEEPSDVYQRVADRVRELLLAAPAGDENAEWWLARPQDLDRKLVKRPVMTVGYGVTAYGVRDQLISEMRKRHGLDDWMPRCCYLADLVYAAIGDVVRSAREVMGWLHEMATISAQVELPIQWTTPVGLPVVQNYRHYGSFNAQAFVGGQRIQVRLAVETDRQHQRKQVSGISPNFVHSLDAAHMMMTVLEADSLASFSMVHDSFGTLACDIDTLNRCLRSAFVKLYETDVLADFQADATRNWPESLRAPALPALGQFNIQEVMRSPYFFA